MLYKNTVEEKVIITLHILLYENKKMHKVMRLELYSASF